MIGAYAYESLAKTIQFLYKYQLYTMRRKNRRQFYSWGMKLWNINIVKFIPMYACNKEKNKKTQPT